MVIGEREKQMGVTSSADMVNRGRGYGNREREKLCLALQIWLIEGVVMGIGEREKQMGVSSAA